MFFRVDFGFNPSEDPEGVVGSEVDEREGNGARPGLPRGGGVEEHVADEVLVIGVWGRVDAEPVELGRFGDSGPLDSDRVARFG